MVSGPGGDNIGPSFEVSELDLHPVFELGALEVIAVEFLPVANSPEFRDQLLVLFLDYLVLVLVTPAY
jgi:hypothetical protein